MKVFLPLLSVVMFTAAAHGALPAPDPENGGLSLPPGFRALLVADNLTAGRKIENSTDQLRFLTVAPNGDLYAKTSRGGIIALRDKDGDGRFEEKQEFSSGGGTGIALLGDWLYHSSNSAVYRYRLTAGQLVPSGPQETVISGLPDERQHEADRREPRTAGAEAAELGEGALAGADLDDADQQEHRGADEAVVE